MAVTLLQAAIDQRTDKLTGALIMMLDQISPVFRMIPMDKIDGRFYDYEQVVSLPSVSWRAVNTAYAESSGVSNPAREYLKILGGEVKIDRHLLRTAPGNTAQITKRRQTEMKLQAAANEWDRAFFEGSELNSPNEMVGLRPRIGGNQLLLNATGGGTLTLANLDLLIDAVPFAERQYPGIVKRGEGVQKCLFMNRTLRRKIGVLVDAATGSRRIDISRDQFGQQQERYNGIPIYVIEDTGSTNTVLGFDEDPGDGTADCASIYCVAFGEGLAHGIYNNGNGADGAPILMDVMEFGADDGVRGLESEPRWMTRFEGSYGLSIDHPRAAARLHGITNT
jgi:putative hemolysin